MSDLKLPIGWAFTTLADAGTWTSGGTPSRSHPEYFNGDIPWIKTGDLNEGPVDDIPENITQKGLENSSAKLFPVGTLLMAMYGATIGKLGILKFNAATNQACSALLPHGMTKDIIPYTFYYLMYERHNFKQIGQGDAQPNISQTIIKKHPFILAPLPEQHRIVEALDSYFSRLDEAVMLLERVQKNLKRYRASVLKAAVEGRLVPTEAELARKEKRDFEPASELLKRILIERRKKWEDTELAKMKAAGKVPKDDKWKSKYKEPAAPDTSGLPELPEGWCWASVEQLIVSPLINGHSVQTSKIGFPVLRLTALRNGNVNLKERKIGHWSENEALHFRIHKGDIFVARGNGSLDLLGRGGLVTVDPDPVAFPDTFIRIQLNDEIFNHRLFMRFWDTNIVRHHLERRAKTTAGIYKINQVELGCTPLPLPPPVEQTRLLDELERIDTIACRIAEDSESLGPRCNRLRQSILKWAFEGKLADQNPNDEPASVLLERIRNS